MRQIPEVTEAEGILADAEKKLGEVRTIQGELETAKGVVKDLREQLEFAQEQLCQIVGTRLDDSRPLLDGEDQP
jgi:hypothetical protein